MAGALPARANSRSLPPALEEAAGEKLLSDPEPEPITEAPTVWELHQVKFSCLIVAVYLATGAIGTRLAEGWDAVTSTYVVTQIITTVGYGDYTVQTPAGQLFISFYVLFGLAVVANSANSLVAKFVEMDRENMRQMLDHLHGWVATGGDGAKKLSRLDMRLISLGWASLYWVVYVLCWTAFFATYETKTWVQSFYMAIVSLTTVGFGDVVPDTLGGRVCAVCVLFPGVVATANLIAELSNTISALSGHGKDQEMSSRRLIATIDSDEPGMISESEFLLIMLLKQHKVKMQDVREIRGVFKLLDDACSGTGQLTYQMVEAALDSADAQGDPADGASEE